MNRLKKFYLFLIIGLIVSTFLIMGLEMFAFSHLSMVQSSIAETAYRSEKIDEKVDILKELEARYEKIEPSVKKINTALPDEKQSSQLLSDLDSLAGASGVKLTLLQATELPKNIKKVADQSLLQTVKGKLGPELPLTIRVEGPFPNFVTFINRLENYQRLISVEGIEMNRDDNPNTDDIEVKLNIRAYLKK